MNDQLVKERNALAEKLNIHRRDVDQAKADCERAKAECETMTKQQETQAALLDKFQQQSKKQQQRITELTTKVAECQKSASQSSLNTQAQQQIVHLRNACQVMELEIKQLRNQQAEGKTQGPHPSYAQTLKNMMTALSKAKLTLEKVNELHSEQPASVEPAVEDDATPTIGVKRPRVE